MTAPTTDPAAEARRVLVDVNVPGMLTARRHGLPAAGYAAATQRRRAGDWRGACEAARIAVTVAPARVRRRYGAEVAERLEDDLRHLVPDLVRWHLPRRWRGGEGLLDHGVVVTLARYGPDGPTLGLRTEAHAERPQRPELWCGPSTVDIHAVDRWDLDRYLWDDRETAGLLGRLGGGARTPFFARDGRRLTGGELPATTPVGDPVRLSEWVTILQDAGRFQEAWEAGGIQPDFSQPEGYHHTRSNEPFDAMGAMVVSLAARAPGLLVDGATARVQYANSWRPQTLTLHRAGDRLRVRRAGRSARNDLPSLPRVVWQRVADLELLRTGHLTLDRLHPLVRTAMFPDRPDDGRYEPLDSTVDVTTVPVRCRGVWHRVGWRGGRVEPVDHTPEEAQRERVMRSLGGEVPRCFTVTESWQGLVGDRLPRRLRELRHYALSAIAHGDTDEFGRLLDLGIDPIGIRDRWGRGPLHHLAKVDGVVGGEGVGVLHRLLAAGLDINARDGKGRTPLGCVLFDGGSQALVRAMLDAGADPLAVDEMGGTSMHLLRSMDGSAIVPWLVAAGVDLEKHDEYGRTPLLTQVLSAAPAAAIRATLDAGADPGASDEYTEQSVEDMVEYTGRTDLDFLVDAARATRSEDD